MTADLVWRAPTPADAEALGRMHFRAWVDTYGPLLPDGWFDDRGPEDRIALWARVTAEPLPLGVRRVAVLDGSRPVAWCQTGPARVHEGVDPVRDEELWGLYVARDHLGTGLGQALLEWGVGDRPAELWVAEGNERAIAFYRRNGFTLDGTQAESRGFPLAELRMVR
ncbi:GNAT family N-acetyltransferase [Phycicoccus sonneratiae]|uniref:GNAT family N-acetyltransferase n=1 Tax=Phycicoccus sonneratiae TaxID=2807628 RepID=A0ABS2CHV6_9MICO|nr:GNAT family N-acetyltransferase [Phycicoccus sonneraticus]MBM6399447.1 GNAT family N-acetyltransferase [Phycicoccus sonneraticus]